MIPVTQMSEKKMVDFCFDNMNKIRMRSSRKCCVTRLGQPLNHSICHFWRIITIKITLNDDEIAASRLKIDIWRRNVEGWCVNESLTRNRHTHGQYRKMNGGTIQKIQKPVLHWNLFNKNWDIKFCSGFLVR